MGRRTGIFSVEYFPPRSVEGEKKLLDVHSELSTLEPEFFSVTYGAGGSTRVGTLNTVMNLKATGSAVAPHLSFGNSDEAELIGLLEQYRQAGIHRLVALRGDIPSGMGSGFQYRYASELVEFIRKNTGDHFHIDVACYPEIHPQANSYDEDIDYFKQKIDAGANSAITQYFYNIDAYWYFIEQCQAQGIEVPIVPGIMPITNFTKLAKFSSSCGAEIPRWIKRKLEYFGDDTQSLRQFGVETVSRLCERLLEQGAPGLHFYSMNQSRAVMAIWKNLSLSNSN